MCVGLSAKVLSVNNGTALIDATGAKREVSAELLADLDNNIDIDYILNGAEESDPIEAMMNISLTSIISL